MDIRASQTSAPPQSQLCTACNGLKLTIADFFDTNPSEIRIDAWGTFRKASLGTFADLSSRPDCPICCLAAKVILLKSTIKLAPEGLTKYEVCLRWEDTVWDKEMMKVRRPVFLGFCSDFDRFDTQFVPTLLNAACGGASTIQYSSRHLRTIGDKFGLVRQWLENCLENHGSTCGGIRKTIEQQQSHVWSISNFVLVDVHAQRLVDAPSECRYAALSYVWGRSPFFNLTKAYVAQLRQPGSLKEHARLVPKTISDSINFVRQIGERYLWVDSLCIVQDDRDQKHELIDNMDLIFSGALLTIIAATGSDANSGLFRGKESLRQTVGSNLDLTGIDFFQSKHENGKWFHETRAWTYQEQLLSKRQVVFANSLTFFVCTKSVWREDVATEETEVVAGEGGITKHFQRPLQPGKDPTAAISSYISCVEAYSRRDLSYTDDGLNAFAGVSKILESDLGTTLWYGLPIKYFELALHWSPKGNLTRREAFPSWSWAGWSGPVDMSPVRRASDFVRLMGVVKGCNVYNYCDPTLGGYWPLDGLSSSYSQHAEYDFLRTYKQDRPALHDRFSPQPGLIQIDQAQCATFNIAIFEPEQATNYRSNLGILDSKDNLIGELEDGHELQYGSITNLIGVHEVIVISEKHSEPWHYELFPSSYRSSNTPLRPSSSTAQLRTRTSGSSLLSRDSPHIKSVRSRLDLKMHKASNWDLFNVMVVEWHDGKAYRLGVGWIFKESLANSLHPGQTRKRIILG